MDILRSLAKEPTSATELARAMGKDRAGVSRKLSQLVGAGLVVRMDHGHRRVTYKLSRRGQRLLEHEERVG